MKKSHLVAIAIGALASGIGVVFVAPFLSKFRQQAGV